MRIVAFTGLAGSGKSTAAQHLVTHYSYRRIPFAKPLKAMLRALGLTIEQVDGSEKDVPCDLLCGKTPRHAMQTVGTEWGRELIGGDIWVRAWTHQVRQSTAPVVCDDCRFPDEDAAIRSMGGLIIGVERPSITRVGDSHISERHAIPTDLSVTNDGLIEDLGRKIDKLLAIFTDQAKLSKIC